jgi:hypothetical protein
MSVYSHAFADGRSICYIVGDSNNVVKPMSNNNKQLKNEIEILKLEKRMLELEKAKLASDNERLKLEKRLLELEKAKLVSDNERLDLENDNLCDECDSLTNDYDKVTNYCILVKKINLETSAKLKEVSSENILLKNTNDELRVKIGELEINNKKNHDLCEKAVTLLKTIDVIRLRESENKLNHSYRLSKVHKELLAPCN